MTINVSALNSTLQTKINALDAATDTKEILLLSKALDAAAGSIAVSDVLDEGVVQVNNVNDKGAEKVAEVNALATNTFKTVGGSSILGSGDIATLPSGGTAGQLVTKDAGNTPVWSTPVPSYLDTATQLFGNVLSANCGGVSCISYYEGTYVNLSENMNNFRGLVFVGSNWVNMAYYPIAMVNNDAKMPSDTFDGLSTGSLHMISSYDTYHYYFRRTSDTQFYIQGGGGNGLGQIWGIK